MERVAEVARAIDQEFANSPYETKTEPEGAFAQGFVQQIGDIATMLIAILSAVFFTILLVAGNIATKDVIAERKKEDLLASLGEVVPAAYYTNNLLDHPLQLETARHTPVTVYQGTQGNKISAMAYEVSSQGYSGEIRLILGLDDKGKVLGVRVLSHSETPGLGDKIEVEKDDSWNWVKKK